MEEIDFRTADFDAIVRFTRNLLHLDFSQEPHTYQARIAYVSTATQVVLGRRASESAAHLAAEIQGARVAVGTGLDTLQTAIADASKASSDASTAATTQARRMVYAASRSG